MIAQALGYRARVDRAGNGVAVRGRGRPHLMFLGHIDTVEGDRPVRRAGGRLHGRGAVDAKGPLACALVAGARARLRGSLSVVAAVREETDSFGARALARRRPPQAVLVGEPSGWDGVTLGYKGDLRLEVAFRRRRSHWSSPEPTAVDDGVAWIERARAALAPHVVESRYRSVTLKVVGADADPAADPQTARFVLDLRLPAGVSTEAVLRLLPVEPRPRTLRVLVRIEAAERERTDPVVRALVRAIRDEGGLPTLLRKGGTSDLNVVAPAWGIPCAAYGPGDARLDHTDRESVGTAELRRSVGVLTRTFEALGAAGGLTLPGSAAVP